MDIALLQMTQTRINTAKQSQPSKHQVQIIQKNLTLLTKCLMTQCQGLNAPVEQQKQVAANDSQAITAKRL